MFRVILLPYHQSKKKEEMRTVFITTFHAVRLYLHKLICDETLISFDSNKFHNVQFHLRSTGAFLLIKTNKRKNFLKTLPAHANKHY
jgi:hypothetical protein